MTNLDPVQQQVLDVFEKHTKSIPKEIASVERCMTREPYLSNAELLDLRLVPCVPDRCRLSIVVKEGICVITFGYGGQVNWGIDEAYREPPDVGEIEQCIEAVIQGQVREEVWLQSGRVYRTNSRILVGSNWFGLDNTDFTGCLLGLFRFGVEKRNVSYLPYVGEGTG